MNHRALAAGLCLVCLSTAVAATQQRQVFRGRADVVPVRVTVTDAMGNPVSGLTAADFRVFEEDVQREIVSFVADAFESADARRIESTADVGPHLTVPPRHFLIVFGDGRVHGPARGLDGAKDLIQKHLLPGDRVAVLGFNRATAFTSDHSTILSVLDRFRAAHESIAFDASEWYFRRYFTELPAAIQRRIDAIFDGANPRGAVELLMGMDGHQGVVEPVWNQRESLAGVMKKATFARRTLSDMLVSSPTSPELKLLASIEYMRRLEGIKHIVWVGNGLRLASVEDDKRLASRATDAGVTLNVIYTSGVSVQFKDFTGAWDIAAAQRLARETGGFSTAVDYADKAVAHIAGMNRFPYVLGYVPLNPAFDGMYRNVRVVTRRAGLTVHHAKGYYARETMSPPDLDELVRDARLKAAALSTEDADDLPFSATAASARAPQGSVRELVVHVSLPASSLGLRIEGGHHVGVLDFQFFAVDGNRRTIGDLRQRIAISLDAASFAKAQADGLTHAARIPITGPARHVKAVVYDYERDRLGSRLIVVR